MAPPSWRAATNWAPEDTIALVTTKLPLPMSPNTCGGPRRASARPTASATCTLVLPRHQRQHASRAAGAAHDGQWSGDQHRPGGRQPGQVRQLRQTVLPGAEQEVVARKRWLETVRRAGVGTHGLDTEADDRRLFAQPLCQLRCHTGRVRSRFVGVQERRLVVRAAVPAGAEQEPAAGWQRTVLLLPILDVLYLEEEVRVAGALGAFVDDSRRTDQLTWRHLRHVRPIATRDPVDRRVEVGADVLAGGEIVPVPGRPAFVEVADLLQGEALGVREGWRQLQDGGAIGQWRGQIDDVHAAFGERRGEIAEDAHRPSSISASAAAPLDA